MGRLRAKIDYEDLRHSPVLQNQCRLASLRSCKTISELRLITSSAKTHIRKYCKKVDDPCTPLRRSSRLNPSGVDLIPQDISPRRSSRLQGVSATSESPLKGKGCFPEEIKIEGGLFSEGKERRLTSAPSVRLDGAKPQLSRGSSEDRENKDSLFGTSRQKKLCGQDDFKHCGYLDTDQPCLEDVKVKQWNSAMGRLRVVINYEDVRNARILENQARFAFLGLHKSISEPRLITSSAIPAKTHVRKYCKVDYRSTPQRHSNRLKGISADPVPQDISRQRSSWLLGKYTTTSKSPPKEEVSFLEEKKNEEGLCSEGEDKKPTNAPLVRLNGAKPDDPLLGIGAQICRQKKFCGEDDCKCCRHLDMDQPCLGMEEVSKDKQWNSAIGRLSAKINYEDIRNARILENQAILASLGLHKTISELRLNASARKNHVRKYCKVNYQCSPLRRSGRSKRISIDSTPQEISQQHSSRLRKDSVVLESALKGEGSFLEEKKNKGSFSCDEEKMRSNIAKPLLCPDVLARRCSSKGRGSVYDPVFGICCHFCRQKKLCGEDDCKRCENRDINQPCLGKTECSVCHSSNGVLCRGCLKVRYGEEMEEVRNNKQWMCPHCIEEKGIRQYWICNSSLCLKKRKMVPTGIAIFRARELGYQSVAHLLMDELRESKKQK